MSGSLKPVHQSPFGRSAAGCASVQPGSSFHVAGVATGGGNHDWPTGRAVPERHSFAVQTLLDAGATLIGKTITDEVSLGILGENAFDGTPVNVRAPGSETGWVLDTGQFYDQGRC